VVIGEVPELTGALLAALTEEGFRVRQIVPGRTVRRLGAERYEVDLSSPEALRELHRLLAGTDGTRVGGLLNALGLCPPSCGLNGQDPDVALHIATSTFHLVKEFADDLESSVAEGGGWFINLTALGGRFGLDRNPVASVAAAGTLGISKTLQREHPRLRVRSIDIDPAIPADLLSARLLQELLEATDDALEIGLTREGRWRPALKQAPPPRELPPLSLPEGAVILLTGGAYGVTADVARSLAACARPRLILAGRSPLPQPEPPRTQGLDPPALRKMLLEDARRRGEAIRPAEIERTIHRILKDRQIQANLDALRTAGATVEYHALDVRDTEQFGRLLDDLYERFGRIDGVIHGAGVIDDKRIADKTPASFAEVFRTKVDSAYTLARKLRPEELKFLVFFGSVSGRFGNVGQVDYSAANEVLNKLTNQLARTWPARVVCINWGPWDGGMVSPELRTLYAAKGIELIPVEEGVRALQNELRLPDHPSAEVVISCSVEQMSQINGWRGAIPHASS
jgi:NAD(P)-dependent dehydrogenase (short-subunit alcohol dehydrogenase family)